MSTMSRVTTWASLQTLTAASLNGEFDNEVNTWNNHDSGSSVWTVVNAAAFKKSGTATLQIMQIVQAVYSVTSTTTSSTYSDTGLTASITPLSASSKIMVHVTQGANATNPATCRLRLVRASTTLVTTMATYSNTASNEANGSQVSINFLDSPASTSALTYKTQFSSSNNVTAVGINGDSTTGYDAVITLTELL